ncbi:hypothetical protein VTI74DRAFT_8275 [Chaetomium olivicolor]
MPRYFPEGFESRDTEEVRFFRRVACWESSSTKGGWCQRQSPSSKLAPPVRRGRGQLRGNSSSRLPGLGDADTKLRGRDRKLSEPTGSKLSSTEAQVTKFRTKDVRPGNMRPDAQAALRSGPGAAARKAGIRPRGALVALVALVAAPGEQAPL